MTHDSESVCFNSLQVTAPAATLDRLLQMGYSKSDCDDWGMSPQNFSFEPFAEVADLNDSISQEELQQIWTNWIEIKKQGKRQQLTLEFESGKAPPFALINAMASWMKRQNLKYDLQFRYRLENEAWDGQLQDTHKG